MWPKRVSERLGRREECTSRTLVEGVVFGVSRGHRRLTIVGDTGHTIATQLVATPTLTAVPCEVTAGHAELTTPSIAQGTSCCVRGGGKGKTGRRGEERGDVA